jgi:hypothetical protein
VKALSSIAIIMSNDDLVMITTTSIEAETGIEIVVETMAILNLICP